MTIEVDLAHPEDGRALLEASHALMQTLFDPEDNHYLSLEALAAPHIRFYVARDGGRDGGRALGCVALADMGDYGEVKSFFVDPEARGRGVGRVLMARLEAEARAGGITELALETGDKLAAAQRLYSAIGFEICGPFGAYEANASSVFMRKRL